MEAKLALKRAQRMQANFPLQNMYYYIKGVVVVLGKQRSYTLYADKDGYLLTSLDGQPFSLAGPFKFTKHPEDNTYSIYSMSQVHMLKFN
jgi:hypothetical protein